MMMIFFFALIASSFASKMTETHRCVAKCARQQLYKQYKEKSKRKDEFDGVGLVTYCYETCGYKFETEPTLESLFNDSKPIKKRELLPGDLIFSQRDVQIYLGNGKVIEGVPFSPIIRENRIHSHSIPRRLIDMKAAEKQSFVVTDEVVEERIAPTLDSDIVGQKQNGEEIIADNIFKLDDGKWISYMDSDGKRRFIWARESDGTCHVYPCYD